MRAELIVFGIIAIVVVIATLTVTIPQQSLQSSSLPVLGPAPELTGITGWLNSQPLTIKELKGKVVLVDFWTYSCINCIRTLPYLKSWHEKYSPQLVIIGVHTPEFEFEKDTKNVKAAIEKYGIKYAVAQDNNYATWRAYNNRYWPRKYLIDKEGNIRYDHIGEGAYEQTEKAIQQLLGLKEGMVNISVDADFSQIGTPELYLGYQFARVPLGNSEGFVPESTVDYKPAAVTSPNIIYLEGQWQNKADKMVAVNDSKLSLIYKAKNVNIVAGATGGSALVDVLVDGNPSAGLDIATNGRALITGHRLYNIISGVDYSSHLLEIYAEPGFELYTFTFG